MGYEKAANGSGSMHVGGGRGRSFGQRVGVITSAQQTHRPSRRKWPFGRMFAGKPAVAQLGLVGGPDRGPPSARGINLGRTKPATTLITRDAISQLCAVAARAKLRILLRMLVRLPAALLVLGLCLVARATPDAVAPADPHLNARGRAILAWFQELQARAEVKLVSGQFCGWSGACTIETLAKIERATGQWPAVIGLDYCGWKDGEAVIQPEAPNELAKAYWRDGGLVTISWHAPNPANPKGYGGLNDKDVNLRDLLKPGPTHDRWMQSLDRVAAGLDALQQQGVVVLWRPLHEMNGGWFWWGAKPGADFIAVWRQMFDYFTQEKKLHNLIWDFGPNHGQQPVANYYPGDTYVDLTGLDAYTDHIDPRHIDGFPAIVALGKPTGFTEFGPHGPQNPPGDYDYRRFVDGVAKNFPQARRFMSWDQKWNPAENRFAKEFYNDPRIIARAALPRGLAGE